MSLLLSGSSGATIGSSAVFNVEGPVTPAVVVTPGTVGVHLAGQTPFLSLGCVPTGCAGGVTVGMDFQASVVAPQGYSGSLMYLQFILNQLALGYAPGGSNPCPIADNGVCETAIIGGGLDSFYPYRLEGPNETNDNPGINLIAPFFEVTKVVSFEMYVFWVPNIASSIPVPLGYVPWDYASDAINVNGAWALNANSTVLNKAGKPNEPNFGNFQPSSYPAWTSEIPAFVLPPACGGNN